MTNSHHKTPIFARNLRQILIQSFALLLVLCYSWSEASAQSLAGLGALSGTVHDPSGATVAKAEVTISNTSIGIIRTTLSSSDGVFQTSSLPPADGYVVVVKVSGFSPSTTTGIVVHVGEIINIPVTLALAGVANDVTVVGNAVDINTTDPGVSALVSQQEINDLPINGRRADQFVLLTPGVTTDGAGGEVTFRGVPGNNLFLQDGMDVTQQWGQDNAGSTSAFSPLSQDAVQEFQVLTSGYTAEFGHAAGGIVNTLTKSGTNNFHGSAFEFFKNRTLNATDPYSIGTNGEAFNPPNWRHQFGGSVGGPVIKEKLFFFANTEETRESRPLVSSYSDAHLNANGSLVAGACDTNTADADHATSAQCAAAQAYIQRTFALLARKLNENIGFLKLDYRPTDRDSVSANFNLMQFASPNGTVSASALNDGSGYYPNGNQIDLTRWARFSYTHVVSNTAVNEFRFGWFKDTRKQSVNPSLAPSDGLVSGLSVSSLANLGLSVNIPNSQPSEDRFLFVDNYSTTVRKHQLKFGAETNYMRDVENALFYAKGEYFYGSITDWAQDLVPSNTDPLAGKHYSGFLQAFGPLLTRAIVRDYNFYGQDQWQVNHKLTLNIGLRYEFNRFTQPPLNPDYPATAKLNEPKNNFAPRVGFAYSMNEGATVVRGGFGISYARLPSASVIRLQQRNGVIQKTIFFTTGTPGAPTFPGYLLATNISGSGSNVTYADPNLKTPYTEQGDFTIEQKMDNKTTLEASYLWNDGVGFLTRKDDNVKAPTSTYTYRILNNAGAQTGTYTTPIYTDNVNDPRYGVLNHIYNGGRLYYDGLALTVHRRQSRYTEASLAYTWSKAIDLGQGAGADNIYYTDPPISVFNGNPRFEKGRSPLDQRHRLVFNGLVSVPKHSYGSKLMNIAANGWQFSGIETYATPQGVDPQAVINGLPFANPYSTSTLDGIGIGFAATQRVPFLPRSSVNLGTTIRTDARLTKVFGLPKEQSVTLNFEVFNAFNYSTITSVQTTAAFVNADGTITPYDASGGGHILATPGVGTASAGFPDGTNARRAQVSARYTF
ncbi:TonB-dependent receptor [Granulicella sibirica]|nr:TonB-dependent receptor [Granulicella sibirica]